jgi:hypothetical protein
LHFNPNKDRPAQRPGEGYIMKNHGTIMLTVLTNTYPELARVFGSGALLEIEWEADIIGLTLFSDDRDEAAAFGNRVYDADAVRAFPRAVRAELCAAARDECEASR